ncbi:MAG TPA: glycosyltransferase [Sulfuriferula sp.]|nr:glycosyltransferase [Sulfuriferula sp.]
MPKLIVAFCTYNRASRLPALVNALRQQACPVTFEILAVNNNSRDNTPAVLEQLACEPGTNLRFVTETAQGIVPARNRALSEALHSDILVFIDDDELPRTGLLQAACDAVLNEGAKCAGGRVVVNFSPHTRPAWLSDDLLGFLAAVDYGEQPFWIKHADTPVWTANVAYDMRLFRDNPDLRFDPHYNRVGTAVGGGEDIVMFNQLLARGTPLRYRPDMQVEHFVEPWRLQRRYFLKLHYQAGLRKGMHELPVYGKTILGVPPFLVAQFFSHCLQTLAMAITRRNGVLRQAMNATHAWGMLTGYVRRQRS